MRDLNAPPPLPRGAHLGMPAGFVLEKVGVRGSDGTIFTGTVLPVGVYEDVFCLVPDRCQESVLVDNVAHHCEREPHGNDLPYPHRTRLPHPPIEIEW